VRVWAVANQKGGVGKTTTAVTLGGLLATLNEPTLLVDVDPQGSLTSYFGLNPDGIEGSVYDLFRESASGRAPSLSSWIRPTRVEKLYVLPASTALATLDRQLGAREGMGLVLKRALAQLNARFTTAIVDCPPALGILLVNALAACERLIIPVQTEHLALKGLERMQNTLAMIARSRGGPVPTLIVPTLYDRRTRACVEALAELRERCGERVWTSEIPLDTRLRDASRAGVPLTAMKETTRGLEAYTALLETLLHMEPSAAAPVAAARREVTG
jgi:chromosome partitioning protein